MNVMAEWDEWERELWADEVLDLFVSFVAHEEALPDGMADMVLRALDALGALAEGFLSRHFASLSVPQRRRALYALRAALG